MTTERATTLPVSHLYPAMFQEALRAAAAAHDIDQIDHITDQLVLTGYARARSDLYFRPSRSVAYLPASSAKWGGA